MTTIVGARASAAAELGKTLRDVLAALGRRRRISRDVAYLVRQDERSLSDIGLSRCAVARATRGWSY